MRVNPSGSAVARHRDRPTVCTCAPHVAPRLSPALDDAPAFSPQDPVPASPQLASIYHPALAPKPFGSQIGG